jgi:hypothetical protein
MESHQGRENTDTNWLAMDVDEDALGCAQNTCSRLIGPPETTWPQAKQGSLCAANRA